MATQDFKRKLTAILSADVKGYSRLMGEDEVATVHTLTAYRELITTRIQQYKGRVVDSPGDNLLAEFASVVDAVKCAVEIQEEIRDKNTELPEDRKMEFRIGLNLGDVIQEGERIYGDGVNIAARVESLAEGGGISISGTAYDQVKNKLDLGYEYLGEQAVKNISGPVRMYRILMHPKTAGSLVYRHRRDDPRQRRRAIVIALFVLIVGVGAFAAWKFYTHESSPPLEVISEERKVSLLIEKPSIAVLPFDNLSGDPNQEYFSDGITEDLITDLSKISGLFVIARNSVFTYKGRAVKIEEVRRELGVKYVLEGSVRKDSDRVRITAQLVDANTGGHLWAERYDRDLKDIFSLQDEVTQKIVTALVVKLTEDEKERIRHKGTDNIEAYDYILRGMDYFFRFTKEANDTAREMFVKAMALDSKYAVAYSWLGWTYWMEWSFGWSQDVRSLEKAFELAQKAILIDYSMSKTYNLLGKVYLWKKQYDQATSALEKSIALTPSDADGLVGLGSVLCFGGRPKEATDLIKKAILLNPIPPVWYFHTLGHAYFLTEQYEEAIATLKRVLNRNPNFWPAHIYLVASYVHLGQNKKAQVEATELLNIKPNYSLESGRQRLPYKDQAVAERLYNSLRKAGLK